MAVPTTDNLRRLAQLLDTGTLKVPVNRTYELDHAGERCRPLAGRHTQGKLAIRAA
jgi:NADPH:quinone reductase-like Zn-dependent oxidoreductase